MKERLRGRKRPQLSYPLRIAELKETQAAEEALKRAEVKLRLLERRSETDPADLESARQEHEAARDAVDECYQEIVVQALPPKEYEALADAIPEAEDKAARRDSDEQFLHAVFVASVVGGDMSEEDWEAFVAEDVSTGERNALYDMANAVNAQTRVPAASVPKG